MDWNSAMSSVRVSVEWIFKDIINYLKVQLGAAEKMYIASTLLYNARCCLYSSATSKYFEAQPPTLQEYFL